MSIEIVVRPASAISVLRKQSVKPATASEDNEAVIEWGNGPLGLAERTNVYDTWDGGGGGDPPPLKWSDLKYVLWHQGGSEHAKEETHA